MTHDDLAKRTIKDLRALALSVGITGASHIRGGKEALIPLILVHANHPHAAPAPAPAPPRPPKANTDLDALKAEVATLTERLNKALDLQAVVAQQHEDLHALIAAMNVARDFDKQHQAKLEALLNEQTEKMKAVVPPPPPPAANDKLTLVTRLALTIFDMLTHLGHDEDSILQMMDRRLRFHEAMRLTRDLDPRRNTREYLLLRTPILLANGEEVKPPKELYAYERLLDRRRCF